MGVTSLPHVLGFALGEATNGPELVIHLCWTEVGALAIAVLLPLVFPQTVDTGTLGRESCPFEELALLQYLLGAVGHVHRGEVARGDGGLTLGTPGTLAHTIRLLAVTLPLPFKAPLTTADAGTARGVGCQCRLLLLRRLLALLPHVCLALGVLALDVVTRGVGLCRAPLKPDVGVSTEAVLLALELPGGGAGAGLHGGGLGDLARLVHWPWSAPGEPLVRGVGAVIIQLSRAPVSLGAIGVSAVAERITIIFPRLGHTGTGDIGQ